MTIATQLNQVKVEPLDLGMISVRSIDEIRENVSLNTSLRSNTPTHGASPMLEQARMGLSDDQPVDMTITQLHIEEQRQQSNAIAQFYNEEQTPQSSGNDGLNQRCAELEKQLMELSKANAALTETNATLASAVATAAQTVATITNNQIAANVQSAAANTSSIVTTINLDTTNDINVKEEADSMLSCIEVEDSEHSAEPISTPEANSSPVNLTMGKRTSNETTAPEQIDESSESPTSSTKMNVANEPVWKREIPIAEFRKFVQREYSKTEERPAIEQPNQSTAVEQVPTKNVKRLNTPAKIKKLDKSLKDPKVLERTVDEMVMFVKSGGKPLKAQDAMRNILEQYFDYKVILERYTWKGTGKNLRFESYTNILKAFAKVGQAFDESISEEDCIKYVRYRFMYKNVRYNDQHSQSTDGENLQSGKKQAVKRKTTAQEGDDGASQPKRKKGN